MSKILIPIKEDLGIDSFPSDSLGKPAVYFIVDSETREIQTIPNRSDELGIPPIKFVVKQDADLVFTKEACKSALIHINRANKTPYRVGDDSIATLLDKFGNGELSVLTEATH